MSLIRYVNRFRKSLTAHISGCSGSPVNNKTSWIVIIILTVPCLLLAGEMTGSLSDYFTVLSSNEDQIVLEWNVPDFSVDTLEYEEQSFNIITGQQISSFNNEPGYPRLPFFTENIGIPADGRIQLQVSEVEERVISDVLIAPNKRTRVKNGRLEDVQPEDIKLEQIFEMNRSAYRTRQRYPSNLLEEGVTAFAGDRKFASFRLNPFQYRGGAGELIVTERAVITIRIHGTKTRVRSAYTGRSYIDRAGDLFFINNDVSQHWRKPRAKDAEYTPPVRSDAIREIQLVVDEPGIYKVTYEDLQEKIEYWRLEKGHEVGFDLDSIDPRFLELSSQYGVTPIHFQGERTGTFNRGDYFEFYGDKNYGKENYSDAYTAENVYTLKLSDNWGARMAVESGGIKETNPRNFIQPLSFEQTVHFEQQNTRSGLSYWIEYYIGQEEEEYEEREDIWFWKTIRAPELSVTPFELQYPHDIFMRGFTADVCLVGSTVKEDAEFPDHHARVRINSAFIEANKWFGQREQMFANSGFLSNQYLDHGKNYLYIDLPGDTEAGDMEAVLLDYFSVTYWREYKTDTDYLEFGKPSHRPLGLYQFQLENFSTDDVYVYKKNSSIIENLQIEPFSETGAAPYTVTFQDNVINHDVKYIAVRGDKKRSPKFINPRRPSDLKNPANRADYIIVTIRDFMESEGTLMMKDIWESRGVEVKIVDIQNIFDEFNYGVRSAYAMRDFFRHAYNNWDLPMTDVLLLGKGIVDERDFSSHRHINHIPFKNVWTEKLGATPSDNWFACIVGDDLVPDFNIARITAWEEEQILAVAEKVRHYLEVPNYQDHWQSKVTLVAGGQAGDETVFVRQNENIRNRWVPADFDVRRVYSAVGTDFPGEYRGGTFRLRDSWNDGTLLIQFMGHGGGRIWADYNLLNNRDIATLNNSNYPFVHSLSCYPSDFSRPGIGSIGENMVLTEGRGAIAHLGFTGLGYLTEDELVGMHFKEAIFHRQGLRFGDIASFTKAKTYSTIFARYPRRALTQSSVLFGDPLLQFNLPERRVELELSSYYLTEGDTLTISADLGPDIEMAKFIVRDDFEILDRGHTPFDIPVIDGRFEAQYVIPEADGYRNYQRTVTLYGYGNQGQVIGKARYAVGQSAVTDNRIEPERPTAVDSIHVYARLFDEHGVRSASCIIGARWIDMIYDEENDIYRTETPFPPASPGLAAGVDYQFYITNNRDEEYLSEPFNFRVAAPDLQIYNIELSEQDNRPAVKALIRNRGDLESPPTTFNLYERIGFQNTLLSEKEVDSLEPLAETWIYVPIEPIRGTLRFRGVINEDNTFAEHSRTYNIHTTDNYTLNMFKAGVADTTVYSLDGNLRVDVPSGLFGEEEIFYIRSKPFLQPLHQPDAHTIPLQDNELSTVYQIGTFNRSALQDTTGMLPDNNRLRVTFNYDGDHDIIQNWQGRKRFSVFRWEGKFSKWINQGGNIDTANNLVFQDVDRLATYTILHNTDLTSPVITANVQDQEFTYGGYVSGTGVISLMLADENGVDIFDRDILLFLNDRRVPQEDYTIAANPENLTSVPIKYQLNLDSGDYSLFVSCSDVNGNYSELSINFTVSTDFDVINLANYPNPVVTNSLDPVNANRTRFTYVLTDDADDVRIKVYTVSGRLVTTLDNLPTGVGYHEYPRTIYAWDCRDDRGELLANGIYFYRIVARRGGKKVERIQKMAIAR